MSLLQGFPPSNVPIPDAGADDSTATGSRTLGDLRRRRGPDAEYIKKQAARGLKHAAAFLSLGLILEVASTFWTLAQAAASGVFDATDCGVRSLSLYHNSRLPQFCERLDSSQVWFDPARTVSVFESCSGPVENPAIEQRCDCSRYDKVHSGCTWTSATSTRDAIEGLCVAVPVIPLTSDQKEEYGTSLDWLLDSSELEYQKDCTPLSPPGFGRIVIALVIVSLSLEVVEAFVGYKRWRDPLSRNLRVLGVAGAATEGGGILTIWCMLMFLPYGILETEITANQYTFLDRIMYVVLAVTLVGTAAEVAFYTVRSAHDRLPYLGAVGNALIWLGSALIEIAVTAYLVWRLKFWENEADEGAADKQTWPVLRAAAIGLVVLEGIALLAIWVARGFLARAKAALLKAKEASVEEEFGEADSGGSAEGFAATSESWPKGPRAPPLVSDEPGRRSA